nr:uncharacterized protein LOC109162453 [Ipomoea trifida]
MPSVKMGKRTWASRHCRNWDPPPPKNQDSVETEEQVISIVVESQELEREICISFVYASCNIEKRRELWRHLEELAEDQANQVAWELELCTAQGLLCIVAIGILATNRKKNLSNGNTGTNTLRLTKSSSHASLEPISSSTWKG